jgi:hypothetical protein
LYRKSLVGSSLCRCQAKYIFVKRDERRQAVAGAGPVAGFVSLAAFTGLGEFAAGRGAVLIN